MAQHQIWQYFLKQKLQFISTQPTIQQFICMQEQRIYIKSQPKDAALLLVVNPDELIIQAGTLAKLSRPYEIKQCQGLTQITLARIYLSDINIFEILDDCSPTLKKLFISSNGIDGKQLQLLHKAFHKCKLEELRIESNKVAQLRTQQMHSYVSEALWKRLKILSFKDNFLQDQDLKFVGHLTEIETLILDQNKLEDPQILYEKNWQFLTQLSLSNNHLTTRAAQKLIANLGKTKRPITLWLLDNQYINEKSLSVFAESVDEWKLTCITGSAEIIKFKSTLSQIVKQIETPARTVENGVKCIKFGSQMIKTLEQIVQTQQTYECIDKIFELDPFTTSTICSTILQEPPKQQQVVESKIIQKQLIEKQQKDPASLILLLLKGHILKNNQANKCEVIFHQKSNLKTQITSKWLCSFLPSNQVMYHSKIEDNEKWSFDELYNNSQKLQKFKKQYRQELSAEFNIPLQAITIHKIIKGSIIPQVGIDQKYRERVGKNKKLVETNSYFQYFHLSCEDFDPRGNITYPNTVKNGLILWRGNWPYFVPVKCERYGLNVTKKYDRGNDRWLEMQGKPGEWAVAFHGVRDPSGDYHGMKVMNSIMKGLRTDGEMLIRASTNAYQKSKAKNKNGIQIGKGVYCSPHLSTCLKQYTGDGVELQGEKYFLVLQSRVNPNEIRVCGRDDFWVISQPKDIRPYGIILIKGEKQKREYPSAHQLYANEQFTWDYYKDKIMNKQQKMKKKSN